jgi:hypothetical protein
VTVAEADEYLEANIHIWETWNALDVDDKGALLIWSTRYLDQRAVWNGRKTNKDSALRWPRTGVKDADGEYIDEFTIPPQLKQAVIEMARYLIESDRSTDRPQDGLKSLKVDVIELVFNESYRLPEVPNEINMLLSGLGIIKTGIGGFAKIRRS